MTHERLRIHLDGIISVLARNLYANPDVFVREMIQNGHDAIVKARQSEAGVAIEGRLDVLISDTDRSLAFLDNGAGLTEAELHEHLSTVGASDKRAISGSIGRFGIGLLSGFIVADRIEVETLARQGEALRWVGSRNGTYTVAPGTRSTVGTTVVLHLRDDALDYLDRERIQSIVRTYADLIGFPIHINGHPDPVNAVHAPWAVAHQGEESRAAHTAYWQKRFPFDSALDTIVLNESIGWTNPDGTTATATVHGVLAVTAGADWGSQARGCVDLFIGRMFVASQSRSLLPKWASFIRGVVSCDAFEPNAARDGVLPTTALARAGEALGRAILSRLVWLSREEPTRLERMFDWHALQLLTACLESDVADFFDAVADLVPLPTDRGPRTLRAYLRGAERAPNGRRRIFYSSGADGSAQLARLASARGRVVVHAGRALTEPFLAKYAARHRDAVELVRLDADADLFQPADADQARALAPVAALLTSMSGGDVRVSVFDPTDLPIALARSDAARHGDALAAVADDPLTPDFVRAAVTSLGGRVDEHVVVHVNAGSAVMRLVASRHLDDEPLLAHGVRLLYRIAALSLVCTAPQQQLIETCADARRLIEMIVEAPRATACEEDT